mmetsp:Transcript_41143/g.96527  ORF Transcript_41143/g.96527 Transcript_41143/m.96527 type:complete len:159 (-) Transcript_41143:273-749(-)|eukprot:CAMPEP_0113300096 /NCGR_PEP_ID=MMETSP0010_2-20120614/1864_1 /TAXON_ID=216773 ORGANISM="Corethron hystrix, Strain 308" /NCGR_SAMPLE_ID=MMETSP0010_2 /ASSEMBLY_ACC=CAM_ASM_000155 /LENGTH=158 /DNA_ID=CAMNT_0000153455 /DNA_START=41 /DNA_END=517 /DNA_ORIENTATION=+ /assembly_acc=CAM_ASM_000155
MEFGRGSPYIYQSSESNVHEISDVMTDGDMDQTSSSSASNKRSTLNDFFSNSSRCRLPSSDNSENTPVMSNHTSFAFLNTNLTSLSLGPINEPPPQSLQSNMGSANERMQQNQEGNNFCKPSTIIPSVQGKPTATQQDPAYFHNFLGSAYSHPRNTSR